MIEAASPTITVFIALGDVRKEFVSKLDLRKTVFLKKLHSDKGLRFVRIRALPTPRKN